MNVLLLSSRSDIGGGPKHLLSLLSGLKGFNCRMFSAIPSTGEYFLDIRKNSNFVFDLPHRKFSVLKFILLIFFCKKCEIDIVHSHGRGAGIYSRLLKIFGFKIIHTFHGVEKNNKLSSKIKNYIDSYLKYFTDAFICVSKAEYKLATDLGLVIPIRTHIIVNGVPIGKDSINYSQNVTKIGTLCRISWPKGIDKQIDFLDKIRNEREIICEIAGAGEDTEKVKEKIQFLNLSNEVKLIGQTLEPISFLKSLGVYVSFSRTEGMPLSVLEAMSLGLPCLLSRISAHEELIDDSINGFLFNLNNYNEFKEKLFKLLEDAELRKSFGENSRSKIQNEFSEKIMTEKVFKLYENIVHS